MSLQDDLKTVETHLEAVKDVVERLSAEVMVTPDPTPAESVLDTVVTALKGFGYEITPPAVEKTDTPGTTTIPVTEETAPLDTRSDGSEG